MASPTVSHHMLRQAALLVTSPSSTSKWAAGCFRGVQIALLLVKELKLESQSALHAWIQSLPQHFSTLMHWSQDELEELQMNSTSAECAFLGRVMLGSSGS